MATQQHWTGSEFDKIVGSRLRTLHPAVVSRRDAIATALTPYERGSCEDNSWTTKYAPSHAEEVLQNDNRAMALYDWLRALTVSAMQKHAAEAKKADRLSDAEKAKKTQKKKARRKAQDDLCGFIAHDDSEDEVPAYQQILQQMGSSDDELAISITTVPSQAIQAPLRKAMLVTGPPGCGKTAAVYAAAEELDFEVFEVNCGTRRSGKDLLERVGDMAQNHLVQLGSKLDGTPSVTVATDEVTTGTPTVDAAKQTTMASFFGVKQTAQQTQHTAGNGMARDVQAASLSSSQTSQSEAQPSTQKHKQSLILLDDVDVLFDEDKQFWSGVSALLEHSKRPIVMTCTDESLVPLDDLDLQAVLELEPAASETVADYCLAIAAQEGHLLKHADIVSLYMSCGKDLRKTLTTLNFWCQMALGSEKAGLDWRPNFRRSLASELERTDMTRTISDGTFVLGQETLDSGLMALTYDLETRSHLREDYLQQSGIGVIDWEEAELLDMDSTGRDGRYAPTIADLQKAAEARSCLDVFCGQTLTEPLHDRLDTEYPTLSTQHMSNYTEAYPVLQADPIVDFSDLTSGIGAACSVLIDELFSSKRQETECDNIMRHAMRRASHSRDAPLCRADFQSALEPLSQADPTKFYGLAGRRAMSLDREIQVMAEDVAPYVRAIVRHDEQDAKRRYEWLREEAGNNPKRRMTRVALAAAAGTDGGGGLLSRRSAYFTRHQDLVPLVLETASQSWQDALRLYMQALPPVEVVPVRPVLQREYEWVVSTQEDFEE
ncbi:hypothetical protein KEM52_002265 [Ascosphaera acerosa]|nr:hypothetical protein KEM52_002265 [Ascosphaera acerosa]